MSVGLAGARSPFLKHGAAQPVNWMPWGPEAFERARRENKPILLDIGAAWCHWCHVMDRESYEDPDTARLINERFVAIKVDRDERPDVDARYQRAVQALVGQGGWPLTAFLTPDGDLFYGGTYFPPEDRPGRPAFRRVLREVADAWAERRAEALEAARAVRTRLSAYEQAETEPGAVSAALLERGADALARSYDVRHGGFGDAPKFSSPGALDFLLDRWHDTGAEWMRRVVAHTLDAMARGGISDQLGGGFHRYATDARWRIPHFEKLAYDNGALLATYARAAAAFGSPLHREAALGVVAYYRDVAPALLAAGGFPASQDADVGPGDDGSYWTWTLDEVREALDGDDRLLRVATLRYGLDDPTAALPLDPDRHVLYRALEPEEIAPRIGAPPEEAARLVEEVRRRLKAARDRRPRPFVDETVYAGATGLVASGHLAAARYLGVGDAAEAALRALDRLWEQGFDATDGLAHRPGDPSAGGYLEDQAYVARALLDAFELTQDPRHLARARALLDLLLDRFHDPESGAFLDRPGDEPAPASLLADPHRPIVDAPAPSPNAVAAESLLRLAALLQDHRYREHGEQALRAFAGSAPHLGTAAGAYLAAAAWVAEPVTTVVVVAGRDAAGETLWRAALSTYRPRAVLRRWEPGGVRAEESPPEVRRMLGAEVPRAYVCVGTSCAAPVGEPEALVELLRAFRG